MAASSNKSTKDLPTGEDISTVFDIEDESDVISEASNDKSEEDSEEEESDDTSEEEESDDTRKEDSEGDSDTSSIVHESEQNKEVSDSWQSSVPNGVERQRFEFHGESGVNVDFDDGIGVLQCFQKFIDEDMWKLFAEQTNIYARQFLANHNLKPRSRAKSWVDTNPTEMKTLIGLIILQGIVHKPQIEMYFSKRKCIETPYFSQIMTEKRFRLLLKFLHFADNSKFYPDQPHKKLYKIQQILDHLKSKFSSVYTPEQNICVDESLLLWKGRLGWVQYIPSKRSRFGVKIYKLCESSTGYVWNFIVYTGKDTNYGDRHPREQTSSRVVLEIADNLLDKGYCLYLDNWYTSPKLVDTLCTRKTDVVGTMRTNRKEFPEFVKKATLNKGQKVAAFRKNQMIMKWKDKRDVVLVSTFHVDSMENVKPRQGVIQKPAVVLDYNKNMGGVDRNDAQLQSYKLARERIKKLYHKMFRYLLDVVCLNAFIIYRKKGGTFSRLRFLLTLGESLSSMGGLVEPATRGRPSKSPKPSRLLGRCFPDVVPGTSKKKPTRRCVICCANGKRKESSYWCPDCEKALCVVPCFRVYHTDKNLRI